MASWLFGMSKLKNDNIINTNEIQVVSTVNPESEKCISTIPQLLYDLQPTKLKTDQAEKPFSMLDNVPFVLLNQLNIINNNSNCNLEDIQRYLLSIKENLESDVYNYDFSNDKKVLNR